MDVWVENELAECDVPDERLKTRLKKLVSDLSRKIGSTVPTACQDWAATKAAYRFFSNPRVDESTILAGHFAATRARFSKTRGPILVLHDTTEFSFKRESPEAIGQTHITRARKSSHTVCGLLMHSSLVLTPGGIPLGLASAKFWTRKKFKGTRALRGKVNLTRIPIEEKESYRWLENVRHATQLLHNASRCVHIGDRESDIFELFCEVQNEGTHFLVRTCVDRRAGEGRTTISRKMKRQPIRGEHHIEVRNGQGQVVEVKLRLRFCRITVHAPVGKQKRYPALSLTVIHAHETGTPHGRKPIRWRLLTDLPVHDLSSAIEKLDWYAQRWKIETFFKVLKSGCRAEESRLRTAARLTNLLAVFCIIGWRVFWLTMVNRASPSTPAKAAFTATEIEILNLLGGQKKPRHKTGITEYVIAVAKLGGYLARGKDPPPGNMVLWRGLARLTDIHLGFELRDRDVGN
ncbi:MAG: IS4 family transposase [Pirellulaceae bacterium]|nr:IS4 family transposase [Planctomycetaceae bacterium]